MGEAVIVSAVRTAIAKYKGALKNLDPSIYGGQVIQEAVKRAQLNGEEVREVIYGNCLAGGGNIARLSLLEAGLPITVPGFTIDIACGSGINSIALAAQAINAGKSNIVVAGGTESMTRQPYLLAPVESTFSRVAPSFYRRPLSPAHIGNPTMGITAENLAEKYNISRKEQDEFAYISQQKMAKAVEEGVFNEQIHPIRLKDKKGKEIIFDKDEHPRPDTNVEKLAKIKPAFKEAGTVTAGSSSGLNDGACALVLMSTEESEKRGLEPLAVVRDSVIAGVDPNIMGIGPVPATKMLLKRNGLTLDDIDLIEINEAFAAQVIACDRELHFDMEKVNVNGGAIAHGHPIAATGGMLVTKLIYEMKRRDVKRGLVTACCGGGQGISLLIER